MSCGEFDRVRTAGVLDREAEARWREHLAGCADCAEQARADALLQEALNEPVPELSPGFEAGLRRELRTRTAAQPARARRPGRLRPAGIWALAAYGTAAAAASAVILARLPWESMAASPVLGMALGAVALLSPLGLLDRIGIVRPPG